MYKNKQISLYTQHWNIWCLILLNCQANHGPSSKGLIYFKYHYLSYSLFFWIMPLYNEGSLVSSSRNNLILLQFNRDYGENYQGHIGSWFWNGPEPRLSFKLWSKNQQLRPSELFSLRLPPQDLQRFELGHVPPLSWWEDIAIFHSPPDYIQWGKSNSQKNVWCS